MSETHRAVDIVQRRFRMSQEMYSDNRAQAAFLGRTKDKVRRTISSEGGFILYGPEIIWNTPDEYGVRGVCLAVAGCPR
jgi:hypothetical protein